MIISIFHLMFSLIVSRFSIGTHCAKSYIVITRPAERVVDKMTGIINIYVFVFRVCSVHGTHIYRLIHVHYFILNDTTEN